MFFIDGPPQGKGRARAFVRNGKVGHYTPDKTRAYENKIRGLAVAGMGGAKPYEGPVTLSARITYVVPKSWPKWKRELAMAGKVLPTVKPDIDNIIKAIKDAINGVVWIDDCQVCSMYASALYQDDESPPGVHVTVAQMPAAPAQCDQGWMTAKGAMK